MVANTVTLRFEEIFFQPTGAVRHFYNFYAPKLLFLFVVRLGGKLKTSAHAVGRKIDDTSNRFRTVCTHSIPLGKMQNHALKRRELNAENFGIMNQKPHSLVRSSNWLVSRFCNIFRTRSCFLPVYFYSMPVNVVVSMGQTVYVCDRRSYKIEREKFYLSQNLTTLLSRASARFRVEPSPLPPAKKIRQTDEVLLK